MRHVEHLVKPAQQRMIQVERLVLEHAEHLFRQRILLDAVVVIQRRLCAPADVERGIDVGFRPLEDLTQLVPVVHVFKVHLFHRRACDDHAVVFLVLDLVKRLIKMQHVLGGRVFAFVRSRLQQLNIHLQGRITQQAQQLRFGLDLGRHQVENQDFQRTDVLRLCARRRHNKNVFALQPLLCRQTVVNFNGHSATSQNTLALYHRYTRKCKALCR